MVLKEFRPLFQHNLKRIYFHTIFQSFLKNRFLSWFFFTAVDLECAVSGELKSPGYPDIYANNLTDVQEIKANENSNLKICFEKFDVEYGANCEFDHVQIVEKTSGKVLLGKTCGDDLRKVVTSANEVEVLFSTDGNEGKSGWMLTWCAPQVSY